MQRRGRDLHRAQAPARAPAAPHLDGRHGAEQEVQGADDGGRSRRSCEARSARDDLDRGDEPHSDRLRGQPDAPQRRRGRAGLAQLRDPRDHQQPRGRKERHEQHGIAHGAPTATVIVAELVAARPPLSVTVSVTT